MLKYFYYIWNLLKNNERLELFYHFGQCLLASILYTITDWQYLILFWTINSVGSENFLYAIFGVQIFSMVIGFWYYFIKYKIMSSQNYFYKLLSNRHYKYILSRISDNATYNWISEKPASELTKQLDSTEKGIYNLLSFMTQFIRLFGAITLSTLVLGYNYEISFYILSGLSIVFYYIFKKRMTFIDISTDREKFNKTNQHNSLIVTNNISLLFDSIIHGNFNSILNNITTYNSITKKEQINMYMEENRTYIKIGLILMGTYFSMLTFVSYMMNLTFKDFTMFFISALLTYKCISHNMNELLDRYADIRQTIIDFNSLEDIWKETKETRKKFKLLNLPSHQLDFKNYYDYKQWRFENKGQIELNAYTSFIELKCLKTSFDEFSKKYFGTIQDKSTMLECLRRFISSLPGPSNLIGEFIDHYNTFAILSEEEVFHKYDLKLHPELYEIYLNKLLFSYKINNIDDRFILTYTSKPCITIKSNSHYVITGRSASGKSTFLKIIRGILHVLPANKNMIDMSVEIVGKGRVDGISWLNLSKSISYSQQNSTSFTSGSIYQILSDDYTSKDKNDDFIKLMKIALDVACVDNIFTDLDYKCNKDTISGGQKQRLIIAKDIFRIFKDNKQIIILDEVDTGLDLETAKKIIINLRVIFKDRVMLAVLHTQELKNLFDQNIFINNGNILLKQKNN